MRSHQCPSHSFGKSAVFVFLSILLLIPDLSRAGDPKPKDDFTEREILETLRVELGPVTSNRAAPEMDAMVQSAFNRIDSAYKAYYAKYRPGFPSPPGKRIHLLHSEAVEAFVVGEVEGTLGGTQDVMFVTTGLVAKLVRESGGNASVAAERLAGIISHEFSHPLDREDPEGFEQRFGRARTRQVREFRADLDPVELLRLAQLPPSALYEGLKIVLEGQEARARERGETKSIGGVMRQGGRSHPQDELRLSVQRLALTYDRRHRGFPDTRPITVDSKRIASEISTLQSAKPELGSIIDKIKYLKQFRLELQGYRHSEDDELRFNKVLLDLDYQLMRAGNNMTPEERAAVVDFNKELFHADRNWMSDGKRGYRYPFVLDERNLRENKYKAISPASCKSHFDLLDDIAFYQTPEYVHMLRSEVTPTVVRVKESDAHGWTIDAVVAVVPSKLIEEIVGNTLLDWMKKASGPGERVGFTHMFERKPGVFLVQASRLFHENIFPKMTDREKHAVLQQYYMTGGNDPVPMFDYFFLRHYYDREDLNDPHAAEFRLASENYALNPADPRIAITMRSIADEIWNNRGFYAMEELFGNPKTQFDWELIFKVKGLSSKEGLRQLREAVVAHTKSTRYVEQLKNQKATAGPYGRYGDREYTRAYSYWADRSLYPHLCGEGNAAIEADAELKDFATKSTVSGLYLINPGHLREDFSAALVPEFENVLRSPPRADMSDFNLFFRAYHSVTQRLLGSNIDLEEYDFDILAQTIDKSSLTEERKNALLRKVFLTGEQFGKTSTGYVPLSWAAYQENRSGQTITAILKRRHLTSASAVVSAAAAGARDWNDSGERLRIALSIAKSLEDLLIEELGRITMGNGSVEHKRKKLETFVTRIFDYPLPKRSREDREDFFTDASRTNTAAVHRLKAKVLEVATALSVPPETGMAIFRKLTQTEPTLATDTYFQNYLFEPVCSTGRCEADLAEAFEYNRFKSPTLQIEVLKRLMHAKTEQLKSQSIGRKELEELITDINRHLPSQSFPKDQFLEKLAWDLHIDSPELLKLIESEKTMNWRRTPPHYANVASMMATVVGNLTPEERMAAIYYLSNPEEHEFPKPLTKALERQVALEESRANRFATRRFHTVQRAQAEIEFFARSSQKTERIPLFELLLSAGDDPLMQAEGICETLLDIAPGSKQDIYLKSYLAIVPEHERTPTVAYLLGVKENNGKPLPLVKIAEAFNTVGIKGGQLGAIWQIFGEQSSEAEKLKDNTTPPTKAEIVDIISSSLSWRERHRVKGIKEILHSASIKTAVLVELTDGSEVVMLVQRPNAENQVRSDIQLARDYIRELRSYGIFVADGIAESLSEAVEEQLGRELRMSLEAKHIKTMATLYHGLNESMRSLGVRFAVPLLAKGFVARDHLLVLERAKGVPYHEITDPGVRQRAGKAIVEASLKMLFQDGIFDADRHVGNFLVYYDLLHPEREILVAPIDFGQTQNYGRGWFRSGDQYHLAQTLRYVREENWVKAADHAARLTKKSSLSRKERLSLAEGIERIFRGTKTLNEKMAALSRLFVDNGTPLKNSHSFGTLKGLMVLLKESYVSEAEFNSILAREVEAGIKRNPVAAMSEEFVSNCARWLSLINSSSSSGN